MSYKHFKHMNKYFFTLMLVLFTNIYSFAQFPQGDRPPKDENVYVGIFDIKTPETDVTDESVELFSNTDTKATLQNDEESKKYSELFTKIDKKRKKFEKNYVLFSFIVEKDGTTSDIQVWLSDDKRLDDLLYQILFIREEDNYPGWGYVAITNHNKHIQVWRSQDKKLNKMIEKLAHIAKWTPATLYGKKVRTRVYRHLFF